ncbi:MAG: hypothetical protein Q9221_002264 [Calogaya cf. arnoldii]
MALVAYSDSEDSNSDDKSQRNIVRNPGKAGDLGKRKRSSDDGGRPSDLPPLPDSFHDLYSSTVRASNRDDPSLHAGRQRQIPHVQGQWPTHVYIESLTDVGKTLPPDVRLESLLTSDLGAALPLHVSLSRTLMLATDQRQPFTDALQTAVEESGVKPFTVALDGLHWVANYEANRWFLVVQLKKPPGDQMNKLLRASNRVALNLNKPVLYVSQNSSAARIAVHKRHSSSTKQRGSKTSSSYSIGDVQEPNSYLYEDMSDHFHISIAWTLQDRNGSSDGGTVDIGSQGAIKLDLGIDTVKAKIGNAIVVLPLALKAAETNGIVGL